MPGFQTSPRNVTALVIEDIDPPDPHPEMCSANTCYRLLGFVRMYIEGCSVGGGPLVKSCQGLSGSDFTVYGRLLSAVATSDGELGFSYSGDIQSFLKD